MLKGGKRPSLWLRNMQLASYSVLGLGLGLGLGLRARVRVRG